MICSQSGCDATGVSADDLPHGYVAGVQREEQGGRTETKEDERLAGPPRDGAEEKDEDAGLQPC
jgi:hypothetical protein